MLHGHRQLAGSKTDKPEGAIIACHKTQQEAEAQHRAILASEAKRK